MSDQDFDRLMDAAAGQMLSHRPSRQLKRDVMTRLREPEPRSARRLVWASSVAALVVCGVIAIALMSRPPATESRPPSAVASVTLRPETPAPSVPSVIVATAPAENHEPATVTVARQRPRPITLPPNDVSAIEPLQMEPIVIAVLEVPPLEHEATSIASIDIEPLVIEPLTASND